MSHPYPPDSHQVKMNDALLAEHPWIAPKELGKRVDGVMNENASWASKRRKLVKIVDQAAAAIAPYSACQGAGCSHCCKTAVLIYESEATEIARFLGTKVAHVPFRSPEQIKSLDFNNRFLGVPCPMLKDNKCSVYEVRPYVCRQQHSLNATPDQCDTTKVRPEDSNVAHFNLKYLEFAVAYVNTASKSALGDIREFFPGA